MGERGRPGGGIADAGRRGVRTDDDEEAGKRDAEFDAEVVAGDQGPDVVDGCAWELFAELVDGDVGACEGLCVVQSPEQRGEDDCCFISVRFFCLRFFAFCFLLERNADS